MKNQNGVAIQLWQKIEDVTTRFDTKHKRDWQADRHTALEAKCDGLTPAVMPHSYQIYLRTRPAFWCHLHSGQVSRLHLQQLQYHNNEILLTQHNRQIHKYLPKYLQTVTWGSTLQNMAQEPLIDCWHTHTDRRTNTLKTIPAFAITAGNNNSMNVSVVVSWRHWFTPLVVTSYIDLIIHSAIIQHDVLALKLYISFYW